MVETLETVSIDQHCDLVSQLLYELGESQPSLLKVTPTGMNLADASEWLALAASVRDVVVDTSYFDESIMFCGSAWDYQSQRSSLLSRLATHLTRFTFTWGGLETLIGVLNPPRMPKGLRSSDSPIDRTIYYLLSEYEPTPPVPSYKHTLANLREFVQDIDSDGSLAAEFRIQPWMGITGIGLHIVRRIRNRFAHGSVVFPEPEDWCAHVSRDAEMIEAATRVALLTVQMMLSAHLSGQNPLIEWGYRTEWRDGVELHTLLRGIHLIDTSYNPAQLSLF